jgi:hypothetical protein
MKLPVRTNQAMLLGNGLIAHVRTVQDFRKTHGKLPQRPCLTYTQLVEQTGAKLALVGIGNFLGEVMVAIHAPDAPEAMQGLTLFVTPRDGRIDFSKGAKEWYLITPMNAPQFRQAVLDFDWTGVEFVSTAGGA